MSRLASADQRLAAELAGAEERLPRLTRLYRRSLDHHLLILLVSGAVKGAVTYAPYGFLGSRQYVAAGETLLSRHWVDAYADPFVQEGPVQLIVYGATARVARLLGLPMSMLFAIVVTCALGLAMAFVVRTVLVAQEREAKVSLELFAGLVAIFAGPAFIVSIYGSPPEAFVALLWVLAAVSALRDRVVLTALSIALSTALKPSGLLALPLMLLLPGDLRRKVIGGATAIVFSAISYSPFALFGKFQLSEGVWLIGESSPLRFIREVNSPFTWDLRLLQGVFVVLVGACVCIPLRSSKHVFWAAPMAISAARLATDPANVHYHWVSVVLLAIIAGITLAPDPPSWGLLPVAFAFYPVMLPFYVLPAPGAALWKALLGLFCIGATIMIPRWDGGRGAEALA